MAERICSVIEDPAASAEIRRNARRTVVERYDLKRICLPAHLALDRQARRRRANPGDGTAAARHRAPAGPGLRPMRNPAARRRPQPLRRRPAPPSRGQAPSLVSWRWNRAFTPSLWPMAGGRESRSPGCRCPRSTSARLRRMAASRSPTRPGAPGRGSAAAARHCSSIRGNPAKRWSRPICRANRRRRRWSWKSAGSMRAKGSARPSRTGRCRR